jgi:hypothetical protein
VLECPDAAIEMGAGVRIPLAILILVLLTAGAQAQQATFTVDRQTFAFEIAPERGGYDRDNWPHWNVQLGGQCFTVRDKVLAEESYIPVITVPSGIGPPRPIGAVSPGRRSPIIHWCRVTSGFWIDPYTGRSVVPADEMAIDHLVPLREAHASGGYDWDRDRRRAYANYLDDANHLVAVTAAAHRRKADRDPAGYLPSNAAFRCTYLEAWIRIKDEWGLNMDQREADAIAAARQGC